MTEKGNPMWSWRGFDIAGAPIIDAELSDQRFPTQSDAETWLGEVWPDLASRGVDAVSLREGDRIVYGPMSLRPPQ